MASWLAGNEVLFQAVLIYFVLALSIQISLRAGVFSLASVGCWGIGGYTLAILNRAGVSSVVASLVALILAGVISYLLASILVRLRGLYLAMATLAFDQMVMIAVLNGGDLTGGNIGIFGIAAALPTVALVLIVASLALLFVMFERGALGRAFDVVRDDEELALTIGLDAASLRKFAFVLSGMVGALGGALHAMFLGLVSPVDMDFATVVLALTMVTIGGFQSWSGALIGAALIQTMPIVLQSLGFPVMVEWWSTIYGILILLIAVYAPKGILGFLQFYTRLVRLKICPGAGSENPCVKRSTPETVS